ncbi:hypothetical protein C7S18_03710 [Ahniella affigens]|uniref:Uncharacterized protein n=1 Tax=Ahniella affigens TaxID=2021234 RepID=A0A2P1PND9_9GAMM|nr:hypothetical protein [Ahniella affigens]AVP96349.1 hypothetical protein C7S18_03710 [Ahniella affigens]
MPYKSRIIPALILIPAALALVGCGRSGEQEALDTAAKPGVAPKPAIRVIEASLPERFRAPLPSTSQELQAWARGERPNLPPPSHLRDHLLQGATETISQIELAAQQVDPADWQAWGQVWSDLVGYYRPEPAFCAESQPVIAGADSALRQALIGLYAGTCFKSDEIAWMDRPDTPGFAILRFYESEIYENPRPVRAYSPRLAAVIGARIENDEAWRVGQYAALLADQPDAAATRDLLALHARIKDPIRADGVAAALNRSKLPEARAVFMALCQRHPEHSSCRSAPGQDTPADSAPEVVNREAQRNTAAALVAAGFERIGGLDLDTTDAVTADDLLVAAGHAIWFDVETGTFPNEHDSLLRSLARLITPTLDACVFEEVPPGLDDESGPYVLNAYWAGKQYSGYAENLGDWYDLDAVLDLINRVVVDSGSTQRFVVLATGDQTAIVLAAPIDTIQRASQAGLIELADPSVAQALGKAAEAHVQAILERGGPAQTP